jgi:hypothetical protein
VATVVTCGVVAVIGGVLIQGGTADAKTQVSVATPNQEVQAPVDDASGEAMASTAAAFLLLGAGSVTIAQRRRSHSA